MPQKPESPKRRLTMNSHTAAYDELLAAQAFKPERHEDEEEDPLPIVYVGPKPRKRKRSTAISVTDPDSPGPPAKQPVASE